MSDWILFFTGLAAMNWGLYTLITGPRSWKQLYWATAAGFGGLAFVWWITVTRNLP